MNYSIRLDQDAMNALAWIADRYVSAEVLYDGSDYDPDTETLTVPEHIAWEYVEALPKDNGVAYADLPPCAGGLLAEALIAFFNSIV